MKVILNKFIPFKGYKCINLFGVLFVRESSTMKTKDYNHEYIHTMQMKEMLYVGFYLWYIAEWLIRLVKHWDAHKAYRNISFEQEAYSNESNLQYLSERRHYTWMDYL